LLKPENFSSDCTADVICLLSTVLQAPAGLSWKFNDRDGSVYEAFYAFLVGERFSHFSLCHCFAEIPLVKMFSTYLCEMLGPMNRRVDVMLLLVVLDVVAVCWRNDCVSGDIITGEVVNSHVASISIVMIVD